MKRIVSKQTPFVFYHNPVSKQNGTNYFEDGLVESKLCQRYSVHNVTAENITNANAVCEELSSFQCTQTCSNKLTSENCQKLENGQFGRTFWICFLIFLFANIMYAPVVGLVDAMTYDILEKNREFWGLQRVWGTLGYASFAFGSSALMYLVSPNIEQLDFSLSFYIFLALLLIVCILTSILNVSENIGVSQNFKNIFFVIRKPRVFMFLVVITGFGIMDAALEVFLFWYLQVLGANTLTMGLCLVANAIGEMFIFPFSGYIISRIGRIPALLLGLLAFAVRFFYISSVKSGWYVPPIELLNCFCFGLMYAGASSYASIIAPEGTSATMQGLVGGLYFGFGKGVGTLCTGQMYDPQTGIGPLWTFRFYGFFAIGLSVVYGALYIRFFRSDDRKDESKEPTKVKEPEDLAEDGKPKVNDNLLESCA